MPFHPHLLIIAVAYAKKVLDVRPEDGFVGFPPLTFTFGLGGLAVFALRFGATATLLETALPPHMIELIAKHRATIRFTAPSAHRASIAPDTYPHSIVFADTLPKTDRDKIQRVRPRSTT